MSQTHRWFVALLPPSAIQADINQIQHYFATNYGSSKALRSPPHITLQPPFDLANSATLTLALSQFAANFAPIPLQLAGFSAFPPRVIFIDVLKTPVLLMLQKSLVNYLAKHLIVDPQSDLRPFAPHLTVAFRDLTRENFALAWAAFRDRPFQADFVADRLTLLSHDGLGWQVYAEFPLTGAQAGASLGPRPEVTGAG
jgi:2'-5' RNA ligase